MRYLLLFGIGLDGLSRGLHENRRSPPETLELGGIHFGHLQERDAEANDDEPEHHGDERDGRSFQTLVQDETARVNRDHNDGPKATYLVMSTHVVKTQK